VKTLTCGRSRYAKDLTAVIAALRIEEHKCALQNAKRNGLAQARRYYRTQPANRKFTKRVSDPEGAAFLHCWNVRPKPVEDIRQRVFGALPPMHQGRCPYCALPTTPNSLDHFREKADLPELALYDRNLIPSCLDCNNQREATFGPEGQRVIHFYDDSVDNIPDVLLARIGEHEGIIVANFELTDPLPEGAALYSRHFKALKLGQRYRRWAATAMRESTQHLDEGSPTAWVSVLSSEAAKHQANFGTNEPRAALLRGLASRLDLLARLVAS
jgi:HNH endonuclease